MTSAHEPQVTNGSEPSLSIVVMGTGRMGTLVAQTAKANGMRIVAQVGFELAELAQAPAADAIIDFSNAATLGAVADYVRRTHAALVSGTTGYDDAQMAKLRSLGDVAPVLHSGNYSLGVACLRHLVARAAHELPGFDVEIVETHHNQKFDTPSGTAKMLLGAVVDEERACGRGEYEPVYGREGMCGARDPHEVGMHSLRGGTVAGVHTVSFFGPDEEVSLTHRATSRQIFVNGAIAATRRLVGREAGFYTFDEVMFG